MTEYDLYVPLVTEKGRRIGTTKLKNLRKELVRKFGGLTYFPQKNLGLWQMGGITFRDRIVIYRVLAAPSRSTAAFWKKLKGELQKEWHQKEVLIVCRDVRLI